jgi:hypothetical protein
MMAFSGMQLAGGETMMKDEVAAVMLITGVGSFLVVLSWGSLVASLLR